MLCPSLPEFTPGEQCIVCLKSVTEADSSISRFMAESRRITICCPLCFEAFEADPARFLRRVLPGQER